MLRIATSARLTSSPPYSCLWPSCQPQLKKIRTQEHRCNTYVTGAIRFNAATMTPVALLTSDAWIEILSRFSSLNDLHSAILSSRQILNAFSERRTTLISVVLRAEITARLKVKPVADAIIIHEAIGPLLKATARDPRYYKRCLGLCRLYSRQNSSYQDK